MTYFKMDEEERTSIYTPHRDNFSNIVEMTNPNEQLTYLEWSMRGWTYNSRERKFQQSGRPMMNDEGISSIMAQTRSMVNQITIMSNLEDWEVERCLLLLNQILVEDLMNNRINYAIGRVPVIDEKTEKVVVYYDASARTKIHAMAMLIAKTCAKRGWKGDDKRFWQHAIQEKVLRVEQGGVKQGRGFPNIFGKS